MEKTTAGNPRGTFRYPAQNICVYLERLKKYLKLIYDIIILIFSSCRALEHRKKKPSTLFKVLNVWILSTQIFIITFRKYVSIILLTFNDNDTYSKSYLELSHESEMTIMWRSFNHNFIISSSTRVNNDKNLFTFFGGAIDDGGGKGTRKSWKIKTRHENIALHEIDKVFFFLFYFLRSEWAERRWMEACVRLHTTHSRYMHDIKYENWLDESTQKAKNFHEKREKFLLRFQLFT